MDAHKNDLARVPSEQLRARRRELAALFADVEHMLAGSLAEQSPELGHLL